MCLGIVDDLGVQPAGKISINFSLSSYRPSHIIIVSFACSVQPPDPVDCFPGNWKIKFLNSCHIWKLENNVTCSRIWMMDECYLFFTEILPTLSRIVAYFPYHLPSCASSDECRSSRDGTLKYASLLPPTIIQINTSGMASWGCKEQVIIVVNLTAVSLLIQSKELLIWITSSHWSMRRTCQL